MAIAAGIAAIIEFIEILIDVGILIKRGITIFKAADSLVDVFEEHEVEIEDEMDLPTARGEVSVSSEGGVIFPGIAMLNDGFSKTQSIIDAASSSSSRTCQPDFNDNFEKYKDKTEPEKQHKDYYTDNEGSNSLPGKGEPNSSADLKNSDGSLIQRRYYDENGKAAKDIDYDHPNPNDNHEFPHEHYWNWDKKDKRGDWC